MGLLGLPIECQVVAVVAVVAVFLVTNIEHGSRLMSSFSIQVKEHQRCEVYYSFTLATATVSATIGYTYIKYKANNHVTGTGTSEQGTSVRKTQLQFHTLRIKHPGGCLA